MLPEANPDKVDRIGTAIGLGRIHYSFTKPVSGPAIPKLV